MTGHPEQLLELKGQDLIGTPLQVQSTCPFVRLCSTGLQGESAATAMGVGWAGLRVALARSGGVGAHKEQPVAMVLPLRWPVLWWLVGLAC